MDESALGHNQASDKAAVRGPPDFLIHGNGKLSIMADSDAERECCEWSRSVIADTEQAFIPILHVA